MAIGNLKFSKAPVWEKLWGFSISGKTVKMGFKL
jgi:hypothetical protein